MHKHGLWQHVTYWYWDIHIQSIRFRLASEMLFLQHVEFKLRFFLFAGRLAASAWPITIRHS
jgi:hypothetical protein